MSRAVSRTLSNIYDFEQNLSKSEQIGPKSLKKVWSDLLEIYLLFSWVFHYCVVFTDSSCFFDTFTWDNPFLAQAAMILQIYLESNTKAQLIISVWSIFWVSTYWCILVHTTVNQKKSYFAEYCGQIFTSQDF